MSQLQTATQTRSVIKATHSGVNPKQTVVVTICLGKSKTDTDKAANKATGLPSRSKIGQACCMADTCTIDAVCYGQHASGSQQAYGDTLYRENDSTSF